MSKWKVVSMERDWEGDPRLPAKDHVVIDGIPVMRLTNIPGTGRPDEVTYRLKLEKWGPLYDLGEIIEQNTLHEVATAAITVKYIDEEMGVTAAEWRTIKYSRSIEQHKLLHIVFDYLRNHKPPLLWSKP